MSEEIIDTVETTTIDAVEAASTVVTSATDEVAGTPWYKRFWSWLCGKAQKLYTLVMPAVKTAVTTFLNDSTNQTLAIAGGDLQAGDTRQRHMAATLTTATHTTATRVAAIRTTEVIRCAHHDEYLPPCFAAPSRPHP